MPSRDLEPKVAKLESSVEAISRDVESLSGSVRDLAKTVSEHGDRTDQQIKNLLVAVTSASGPRKTDWSVLVAAAGLILAIGAAAFTPVVLRIDDANAAYRGLESKFSAHEQLQMHPVGKSRVDNLETAMKEYDAALDQKLQKEAKLMEEKMLERISSIQHEFEEVERFGSPITRERLAVIEEKLKHVKYVAPQEP